MSIALENELSRIRALPKIDLHVHLEGSARRRTLIELATRNEVKSDHFESWGAARFSSLAEFIRYYSCVDPLLTRPEDLRRLAVEVCEDKASDGVRYAEVTFTLAPRAHAMDSWELPIVSILDGFAQGASLFGVQVSVILDIVRGSIMKDIVQVIRIAKEFKGPDAIIGIGLTGDEELPLDVELKRWIMSAVEDGLIFVPHAGEKISVSAIREMLGLGIVQRIGHGIAAVTDAELLELLRFLGIALEVCPTSNIATGVVSSLDSHPLRHLLNAGVTVVLGTDDPGIFGNSLTTEYAAVKQLMDLDEVGLANFAQTAVKASFMSDSLRSVVLSDIEAWLFEG